ncbi:hypothetical protein D0Y65_000536 [Glycine soja]|uniref:Uncharacterized protein n=1 Tax=Glycine soja TaxID=3848 RepID=A0A445LZ72_GLYSO|nr:hypothetical protein D0Y65_000536 [Glycine soja]
MNQRLEIPKNVDPRWASIIESCWHSGILKFLQLIGGVVCLESCQYARLRPFKAWPGLAWPGLFPLLYAAMTVTFHVNIVSAANVTAQVNSIPMLNETNFKVWKDALEIVLGCMDLDLALRMERPISTSETSNEVKIEKWDQSNRMCLMIMKRSIPEAFWGSISEGQSAKKFLKEIEQYFAKNEKNGDE